MNTMKLDTYQNIIQIDEKLDKLIKDADVKAGRTLIDSLERNIGLIYFDGIADKIEGKLIKQLLLSKYDIYKPLMRSSLNKLELRQYHDYTIIFEKLQRMISKIDNDLKNTIKIPLGLPQYKNQFAESKFKLRGCEMGIAIVSTSKTNAQSMQIKLFGDLEGTKITANMDIVHPNKSFRACNPDLFRGTRGNVLYIDYKLGLKFYIENLKSIEHFDRVELIEETDLKRRD
ncbi:hypothetical protein [Metabacillus arenae]|uniref:Uncharacterized protein n=1 Tax=Metabacillus arenae TaxID=2771434 RepID=A0A926ND69_9BACI|nr:hypothetical protein [Metabacillus arenae]MBD1379061.1 hypothetical protein [Metabacillus arenae]